MNLGAKVKGGEHSERKRVGLLLAIAMILAAVLAAKYLPSPSRLSGQQNKEAVQAKIQSLRRLVSSRDDIAGTYADLSADFGVRFAGVDTYVTSGHMGPSEIEQLIRKRIAELGPLQSLSILPGSAESLGDGIERLTFNVSFSTNDEHLAMAAAALFAQPQTGLAWDSLVMTAEPRSRKLAITGRVLALLVEPVE